MRPAPFTYLLLCHTDPPGVRRLVRRIRELSPEAGVVVRHHGPLLEPAELAALGATDLSSDRAVAWGDWSQVEMVLEALDATRRLRPAGHYVVLSGQDYPIRDLARWEAEVAATGADVLLDEMRPQDANVDLHWSVRREPPGAERVERRALRAGLARLGARLPAGWELYPVSRDGVTRWWFGRPRRQGPPIPMLKAAQWCTLSDRAVEAVLARHARDDAVRAFFRTVRVPDEFYVGSLAAACDLTILRRPTTAKAFVPDTPSPRWVDLPALEEFAATPAAFARKIPPDVDPAIIARADELASRRDGGRAPTMD